MDRRAAVVLDAVPEAPRRARRFLSENLAVWERLDLMERAALALSELVTNAFLHAHGEIEVNMVQRPCTGRSAKEHLAIPGIDTALGDTSGIKQDIG